jgi:hypothetical protein
MSATSPQALARLKKVRLLRCSIVSILAAACGGLPPAVTVGAEADRSTSLQGAGADDKAKAAQLLQDYRNGLVLVEGKTDRPAGSSPTSRAASIS